MKKIIYTFMAFALLAASSCEEKHLDIEQKGVTSQDDFYKTNADCEQALAAAYADFATYVVGGSSIGYSPLRMALNCLGDDFSAGGATYGDHDCFAALNEYRYDAGNEVISNLYAGLYKSIYACNLVIDHFKDEEGPGVKKTCVAEARVLRAYGYFILAVCWGCPPFVDHCLSSADEPPYNCDKDPGNPMSHEDLLKWVAKECNDAATDLTERESKSDRDGAVRVTKGFAYAFAGKAYLFAGMYADAKAALKKVIDSGKYALVPGDQFANLFHVEGDANEEKVFELNLEYIKDNYKGLIPHSTWKEANLWAPCFSHFAANPFSQYTGGIDGWGCCGIPEWYGGAFQANDGNSYRRKATIMDVEESLCLGEDARAIGLWYDNEELSYMLYEELQKSDRIGITDIRDGLYGQSFWIPVKPIVRGTDYTDGGGRATVPLNNAIVMRYAEVLLMYAEACIQTGRDLGEALRYLNGIQERAGSAHKSTAATMDELKNEKLFECWLEGCRWADVIRWNDTEGKARMGNKAKEWIPHVCDKLHREPQSTDANRIWQHGTEANSRFYIIHTKDATDRDYEVGFKAGKHELFPYPQSAIDRNPNLVQNPGWGGPQPE